MAGIKGFSLITLAKSEWGPLSLLRPLPREGDDWGLLAGARGTDWEPHLKVIPGSTLSYALHGYTKPLVDLLGRPPLVSARKIPDQVGFCRKYKNKTCAIRKELCRPGGDTPLCYEPDVDELALEEALYEVVMAWKDGIYVLIIEGSEFSF